MKIHFSLLIKRKKHQIALMKVSKMKYFTILSLIFILSCNEPTGDPNNPDEKEVSTKVMETMKDTSKPLEDRVVISDSAMSFLEYLAEEPKGWVFMDSEEHYLNARQGNFRVTKEDPGIFLMNGNEIFFYSKGNRYHTMPLDMFKEGEVVAFGCSRIEKINYDLIEIQFYNECKEEAGDTMTYIRYSAVEQMQDPS